MMVLLMLVGFEPPIAVPTRLYRSTPVSSGLETVWSPLFSMRQLSNWKPLMVSDPITPPADTVPPKMPLWLLPPMFMRVRRKFVVLTKRTPGVPVVSDAPVLPEIEPPVQVAADVQLPPLPVTVSPPLLPVVFRTMPGVVPPADVMLRKVRPLAPIVVFTTLSAVPPLVVRVLTIDVLFWVALTLAPAPLALK